MGLSNDNNEKEWEQELKYILENTPQEELVIFDTPDRRNHLPFYVDDCREQLEWLKNAYVLEEHFGRFIASDLIDEDEDLLQRFTNYWIGNIEKEITDTENKLGDNTLIQSAMADMYELQTSVIMYYLSYSAFCNSWYDFKKYADFDKIISDARDNKKQYKKRDKDKLKKIKSNWLKAKDAGWKMDEYARKHFGISDKAFDGTYLRPLRKRN